jgi:type I restriction enzyme S subunit
MPVAPPKEQDRIVAEIEKQFTRLDAATAALKRAQANLKRYRASVLKAACEGRLVPTEAELARKERRDYESANQLLQRILRERRTRWEVDTLAKMLASGKPPKDDRWREKYKEPSAPNTAKLHPLPEGWCWASIDQISIVVRGASPRPAGDPRFFGGDIPWITVGMLTRDDHIYFREVVESVTEAGRQASRYIEPDTLLLTNSGATLGVPKITMIGGCINDGSVALQGLDYPEKLYLYFFLSSLTKSLRRINQGAAQPNLNTEIVKGITVPLPPRAEQVRICERIEVVWDNYQRLVAAAEDTQIRAIGLRSAVLRDAFVGALIPQNADDESASALLERIRSECNSGVSLKRRPRGEKEPAYA